MPVKNKKIKNKTSSLAREMRRGFKHLDEKIGHLDGKIDKNFKYLDGKIDKNFKYLDGKIDKKIDDLAMMTKRGFDDVDKRFMSVDERFISVDKRFDDVDKRFDDVDKRFDKIEKDIKEIKEDISRIENKLDRLERRILSIEDILTKHGKTLRKLRVELVRIKRDAEEEKYIGQRLNNLEIRVEKLELKLAKS